MSKYLFFFAFAILCNGESLRLNQVVILSRHNIRRPFMENLDLYTPNKSLKGTEPNTYLTAKGAVMEGYISEYIRAWVNKEGLLPHGCPTEDAVHIYANTAQRAKETAKSFANSAFRCCNFTVHYKNITEYDPIYKTVLHNTNEGFINTVYELMSRELNKHDFTDVYLELENILDYKKSDNCLLNKMCSLTDGSNFISLAVGKNPVVKGPPFICNSIVDTFVMSYYDGLPIEEIGWGRITKPEQWVLLTKLTNFMQNIRYNMTYAAKDYARPLLNYMANIFINKSDTPFTLLVGHDSNLNSVTAALSFKSFVLPGQYEAFPIGGKVVFQKFTNESGEDYLKVEYVYQKWVDIRNGVKPTLDNPPQRVILEMRNCEIDNNGLCPWSEFVNILKEFV